MVIYERQGAKATWGCTRTVIILTTKVKGQSVSGGEDI